MTPSKTGLWRCDAPLLLASKSAGRRFALAQTGAPFEIASADVDERLLEAKVVAAGGGADEIAAALARAKALALPAAPRVYVIGADQVASCENQNFGKPETMARAKELLVFLSGRTHRLHSAIALARNGRVVFETIAHADMTMRQLSEEFIDAYLAEIGEQALTSAGAYQVEGLGAHLFKKIVGDHWTILGLPLLPLLDALRREGVLLS